MKSYIFKMSFISPVHFGIGSLSSSDFTCGVDTLFSAIFQEWLKIFGSAEDLLDAVNTNKFRITNLMPFHLDDMYIPKPILFLETDVVFNIDKKTMKKLKFIPIRKLEEFIYFLKNGGDLHIDSEISFAKSEISQKVVIDKNGESTPFSVATFRFKKNAGLYFVAELSDAIYVKLRSVMDSLSSCGIGGERSTGYGKFEYDVSETNDFATKKAELYIALSSIIPTIDDLDLINNKYCSYILSEKGGYVDSLKYA